MFFFGGTPHWAITARKTPIQDKGFSLLEVMVSLCLFSMGLLGLCRLHYLSYELCLTALQQAIVINDHANEDPAVS